MVNFGCPRRCFHPVLPQCNFMKVNPGLFAIFSAGLLIAILVFYSCKQVNLPPVAALEVFPPFGDTSVLFELRAAGSEDDHNYPSPCNTAGISMETGYGTRNIQRSMPSPINTSCPGGSTQEWK